MVALFLIIFSLFRCNLPTSHQVLQASLSQPSPLKIRGELKRGYDDFRHNSPQPSLILREGGILEEDRLALRSFTQRRGTKEEREIRGVDSEIKNI